MIKNKMRAKEGYLKIHKIGIKIKASQGKA